MTGGWSCMCVCVCVSKGMCVLCVKISIYLSISFPCYHIFTLNLTLIWCVFTFNDTNMLYYNPVSAGQLAMMSLIPLRAIGPQTTLWQTMVLSYNQISPESPVSWRRHCWHLLWRMSVILQASVHLLGDDNNATVCNGALQVTRNIP